MCAAIVAGWRRAVGRPSWAHPPVGGLPPSQEDGNGGQPRAQQQQQRAQQQREEAAAQFAVGVSGDGGGVSPSSSSDDGSSLLRRDKPAPISLRVDLVTQAVTSSAMMIVLSLGPHWQPAAVTVLSWAGLLVMARWPHAYWRNRTWLLPILRCIILVVPSIRSAGVGYGITRSLDRPATPGLTGALVDFLRLLTAIRLLPWAVQTHFMLLPPAACFVTHLCLTIGSSNLGGFCSTQMLSDALARRRQAAVTTALDVLALPVVGLVPGSGPLTTEAALRQGLKGEEAMCRSTLLFLQVFLGVLIPLATSCYLWTLPPPRTQAAAATEAAAASTLRTSSSGWRLRGHVCNAVRRGAAAVDSWLPWLLGLGPSRLLPSPVPVLVIIGGYCWMLCRMHAGLL